MADGLNFVAHIARFIGETVTIFTTSGGESGSGFTGVVLSVNNNFVRLITQIGPAPGCALGNCCSGFPQGTVGAITSGNLLDGDNLANVSGNNTGRPSCRCKTVGSVVDIPIDRIVAFVHNAV